MDFFQRGPNIKCGFLKLFSKYTKLRHQLKHRKHHTNDRNHSITQIWGEQLWNIENYQFQTKVIALIFRQLGSFWQNYDLNHFLSKLLFLKYQASRNQGMNLHDNFMNLVTLGFFKSEPASQISVIGSGHFSQTKIGFERQIFFVGIFQSSTY